MEHFVFHDVVLKLASIERLYCSINEEVIDPDDTRYKLLHDCASAILSLQSLLSTYCSDWHLNWSVRQKKIVDRVLMFDPFDLRCNRENRWFKPVLAKVVVVDSDNDLPF